MFGHRLVSSADVDVMASAGELVQEMWGKMWLRFRNDLSGVWQELKFCCWICVVYGSNEFVTHIIENMVSVKCQSDVCGFLHYSIGLVTLWLLSTMDASYKQYVESQTCTISKKTLHRPHLKTNGYLTLTYGQSNATAVLSDFRTLRENKEIKANDWGKSSQTWQRLWGL